MTSKTPKQAFYRLAYLLIALSVASEAQYEWMHEEAFDYLARMRRR